MQLDKARQFIKQHARPVDQRLYEFYFENGSAEAVLNALAAYQNEDGGFGHGIEADFRLPHSSPMATSVGLQYAHAVEASPDHPVVAAAIAYLEETFDRDQKYWPIVPSTVVDYPHAVWWHIEAAGPPATPLNWANPNAELAGYVHWGETRVLTENFDQIAQTTAEKLAQSDLNNFEGRPADLIYCLHCWERALSHLPSSLRDEAAALVHSGYQSLLPLTAEKLEEHRLGWLVEDRDAILYQIIPDQIDQAVALEASQQQDDGAWWPSWAWGQYEEDWQKARIEWAGKLTTEMLARLRAFGHI